MIELHRKNNKKKNKKKRSRAGRSAARACFQLVTSCSRQALTTVVERLHGWFAQSGQRGDPYNDRERETMAYGRAAAAAINECKRRAFPERSG